MEHARHGPHSHDATCSPSHQTVARALRRSSWWPFTQHPQILNRDLQRVIILLDLSRLPSSVSNENASKLQTPSAWCPLQRKPTSVHSGLLPPCHHLLTSPMRPRRSDMAPPPSSASLSLAVGGRNGFVVASPPQGLRNLIVAGAAVVSGLVFLARRAPQDAVRRRVVKRLDRIAPKRKSEELSSEDIINTDCS